MSDLLGGGFGFVWCGLDWFGFLFARFMLFGGFGAWATRWHKLGFVPLDGFCFGFSFGGVGVVWLYLGANATVCLCFIGMTQ